MSKLALVLLLVYHVNCAMRSCDELIVKHGLKTQVVYPNIGEKGNLEAIFDEKFKVDVSNTGPAVIGSQIDFLAELSTDVVVTDKKRFLYHWMNDADNNERLEATNNYKSNISSYIFDSDLILPNKYKMKVCVYKRHKEFYVKVAENYTLFELTASLNGIAHLYQNHTYNKTQPSVFCTDRTMQYSVNLTDKFPIAPTFWFKWFIDGRHIETEENRNFFEFVHNKTGLCRLTVEVTMDSFGKHKTLKRSWLKHIYFEEEIQTVEIISASEMVTNKPFTLNVTYDGSNVTVCWRIVDLNNNSVVNRSCDQPLSGGWFLTPEISLSQGQYIVQVNVTNDVSAVSGQSQVLSVYNGGGASETLSTLVVPVVFSMLGLVVVVAGAAYVVRLRKKSNVEVANFDFHPDMDSSGSQIFSRFRRGLSSFFQRNEYIRRHRLAKYQRTSAKSYGAVEEL